MDLVPYLAATSAIAALFLAAYFFRVVKSADIGNDRMNELMQLIQTGARAFLKQEYKWVAVFVAVMVLLLLFVNPFSAVSYLVGAFLSGLAGWIGMTVATMANARTAHAAITGPQKALPLAFKGGAVMGYSVAGLSLLGLVFCYLLFAKWLDKGTDAYDIMTAFGLGASTIALFSRVGGGIYTKAADVGADLVGKVEAGIPEDDPRNPATIADNVGDNVGDVAGMGADLFESYAGSIIAPMAFAAFAGASAFNVDADALTKMILFPFVVASIGMVGSIVGSFTVRCGDSSEIKDLSHALHMGTNVAMGITVVGVFCAGFFILKGGGFSAAAWWSLPLAVVIGLAGGYAIGKVAEIWTSDEYQPVKNIAAQAETGTATVILKGVSAGMLSVAASVCVVVVSIVVAYWAGKQGLNGTEVGGIYGIAISAIGMLATTGVVVAVDAYGPIADNAGGIAQMANLPPEVRKVTDSLDSLGNTTAAIAKGFAVGSAAVTALALFASFDQAIKRAAGGAGEFADGLNLDIGNVEVFVGLFLGAMLPFLFAALTIDAVGRAAGSMIDEVRRQFREIPGLREGKAGVVPDSATCVAISTKASLREMMIPGGLAVVVPLVIGIINVNALGGFLAGALVSGFALAIYMSNAGGAWDNAKKYIEAGSHGGKGSEQHKAAVVGDTVGDPFKDTCGPAMNILIKVMTIVSLTFVSVFI